MESKQIVVIGAGRFGASFAETARELGHEVLLIDRDADRIDGLADRVTHAVVADVSQDGVLYELGISNFDIAVIAIVSNYQASIMSALVCKELGIPLVIAKAKDEIHARVLDKIGATKTVFPERDSGIRLAHSLTNRQIMDFIALSEEFDLLEIRPLRSWVGKSIKQIDIRHQYGLNVIALKEEERLLLNPGGDTIIQPNTILTVLGHKEQIRAFERLDDHAN